MTWGTVTIKKILGSVLSQDMAAAIGASSGDMRVRLGYHANSQGRRSARLLRTLKNRYQGKRCFIIGNGPSLKTMDLSPLRHEFTFGLNRMYLMFEKLGFSTTFLVSVNRYVIEQCADDLQQLPCTKFISWGARHTMTADDTTVFVPSIAKPLFSTDPGHCGVWEGGTVTYVAMQLAYYLGFQQVVLIGVDHAFSTQGPANQLVTSTGDDPNHFDPAYFGKGFRWQLPDLETSEFAYRMAKLQYQAVGREILDATVGGKLTVYDHVSYHSLF